jgi:2-oxoglutarate/2-oxoacid ferredoxin oxidoreductase subunit beta
VTLTRSGRIPVMKKKDFESDQEVRWCPGCGDYAILAAFLKTLPTLGIPRENHAIISGIGCAARFPYYVNTYGFHTIHGRAPAFASGLKCANPDLTVWIITGDGDALSIGGNHLLHCLRRNVNVNILLFNNRIYGLTKGQYSPTSEKGKVTKSTPLGSIESPVNPLRFAMASEATFVARTMDCDLRHMSEIMRKAVRHKGVSFVEIMQNCIIFNDGTWKPVSDKKTRAETTITLEDNTPLIFGQKLNKGLRLKGMGSEVVEFDPDSPPSDLIVHDEAAASSLPAYMLTEMDYPEFPIPVGVFRQIERPTYEEMLHDQNKQDIARKGKGDLKSLLHGTNTWLVDDAGDEIRNDKSLDV